MQKQANPWNKHDGGSREVDVSPGHGPGCIRTCMYAGLSVVVTDGWGFCFFWLLVKGTLIIMILLSSKTLLQRGTTIDATSTP